MNHAALARLNTLDAHDQAALVHSGEASPTDLVKAALLRIEQLNPILNAVSHVAGDHASASAGTVDRRAPMAGVPCLLKASMEYTGFPHISGSRTRKQSIGGRKYPFGEAMDRAGLIACGMTTMPEFGLLGSGEALVYGPTRNPWNLDHGAGGSSSGAGVAVATGMVPFATGSDGGGSIRIPASHNGVIGFKPSRDWNLKARGPGLMDDLLACDGLLARTMRDATWAARHLRSQPAEPIQVDRSLRIALNLHGLDGQIPEREITDVIEQAANLCRSLGHAVEEVGPLVDLPAANQAFGILWSYGAGEVVDISLARSGEDTNQLLEPWTLGLAERRKQVTSSQLAAALSYPESIDQELNLFWKEFDVVLSPVTGSLPPRLGVLAPDRAFDDLWSDHFRHVNHTQLQNMAGYPGISLPLFQTASGLPAGAMFWGPRGSDDLLLAIGQHLEDASPWSSRWPPILEKLLA